MKTLLTFLTAALVVGLAAGMTLIQPKDLAAQLSAKGAQPVIVYVGPNLLYRGKHIPGSIYAGPSMKQQGLDDLKQAVAKIPHDREIVLYCGCCPWENCPNVKPASEMLKGLGYTQVKVMYVESSFAKNWTEMGYPVEQGTKN
jgi:hypothetical protein